ncbi:MAG: DUF1858 domain-containing protein [Deltaproteobacteria bacterium]|nr:DUF1858 domain-containing protein [Deltaproteobacteria bacterium]
MVTLEMSLEEIVRRYPQTREVFERFGLDCLDCQLAGLSTVKHCAEFHDVETTRLLEELNAAARDR